MKFTFFYKLMHIGRLAAHYSGLLVRSNLKMAREVLTVSFEMDPAIIGIDLDLKSDAGIFLLINLITMTPGSLSLDITDDKKRLYVHLMYAKNVSHSRQEIKRLEDMILKIFSK